MNELQRPFFIFDFGKDSIALTAPLDLNEPAFWKFSHLKNSFAPNLLFNISDERIGVL